MPRRLTKEQIDYIKVHINDYPRKEVAKAAGVTLHTLYKYITILGGTKIDNKLSKETHQPNFRHVPNDDSKGNFRSVEYSSIYNIRTSQ